MENRMELRTNTSVVPQRKSQQTAVSLSKRYKNVTTIAQAFALDEAPIAKTQGDVHGTIVLHLSALSRFLNLKVSLTDEHIDFIADKILSDDYYKWLKPADLKIFFDRIKMGRYGDFYGSLNSISFFQSLDKYMVERNGEIEHIRDCEAKELREKMKGGVRLSYYINADGRIEYTSEKKKEMEDEKRRQEEVEAESRRKREVVENFRIK